MKIFFILSIFSLLLAREIYPSASFLSSGFVNDFVIKNNKMFVANDAGTIDIFNIKTKKLLQQIKLPLLTSSMNNIITANILSVDYLNNKLLILSVGENSYRNLWIYEKHKLTKIISEARKLTIKEARFVNNEQIVFSTLGSDIVLYNTSEKYNIYQTQVSQSAMSDIVLSPDKKVLYSADESGSVYIINAQTSKTIKSLSSLNVDNIYKIAYAKGTILTAGQDRRVGVYQKNKKPYYIKSDFFVFCVGISPSGKIGIYSSGERNVLQLFNIKTKIKLHKLIGHTSIINKIYFTSEKYLYTSSMDNNILYWEIN